MVFGLFSKKDKNAAAGDAKVIDKGLQRTIDRATNKLSQQADRLGALERLNEDGSEDALFGMCKRWSVTSMKAVEDEWEKSWVADTLIHRGHAALEPVVRFAKTADQLAFALKVIEKVADKDKILQIADELLASEKPGYARFPERRIDLLRWLSEWKGGASTDIVPRLVPYLNDFDENVKFTAIDGLALHDPALIAEPLVTALLRPDEESGRIRRTLVEVLAGKKLPLGGKGAEIGKLLTGPLSAFKIDGDRIIAR